VKPGARAPLPLWTRAVYGSGDWSLSTFNTFRQVFYAVFLTDVVGLDARLASFAALIGVCWDAINDPVVGVISDRLHTRWGRRRPLMLVFAVPFGLSFVALWWAPPWESQWALMVHVALAYMLTDTMQSLVTVPFFALTPELTPDYDERTALTAWRTGFNLVGALAVAVAAPSIVDHAVASGASAQQGYLICGALFGGLGVIPPLLIVALIRERSPLDRSADPPRGHEPRESGFALRSGGASTRHQNRERSPLDPPRGQEAEPLPIRETFQAVWQNVPFRYLTVLYLLNWITFDLVGLMIPFFVTWWLASGSAVATLSLLGLALPVESAMLGALLVVSLPAVPLWVAVSNRIGKRATYAVAMSGWVAVQLLVWLVPPGRYPLAVLAAAACGLGVAAAHVIPDAMLPDVIDEDELRTGRRNEGAYYGARNLFRKAAGALAVFGALQILGWTGYRPSAVGDQADAAVWAIRALTGPAGAMLLAGAIVASALYPMGRARHAEIRRQLAERRGE
jgi:glycoside/pentoside/hexuronide:cation symporter, GPH family